MYYLEWMAAGTVPITFSNIGTRSLIENSQAGVIVENENITELREAALYVLKESSTRDTYSKNCVAAAQHLSWDNIAQQYMKIYAEILRDREEIHALT
jgi:glycosyltransferase involved in cell wall biosynthesis